MTVVDDPKEVRKSIATSGCQKARFITTDGCEASYINLHNRGQNNEHPLKYSDDLDCLAFSFNAFQEQS